MADRTVPARLRAALLVVLTVALAIVAPAAQPPAAHAADDLVDLWRPGDVHVHAAGDSGLGSHIRCQDPKPADITCANYLVRETHRRAKANGIDWMIYTEHVPWLGIHPVTKRICVPSRVGVLPMCMTIKLPRHDAEQDKRQYDELRDATAGISTQPWGVRGLMGQELGTAAQITVPLGWAKRLRVADYDEIVATLGREQVDRIRRKVVPQVPNGIPLGDQINDAASKAAVTGFVRAAAAGLRTALDAAVGPILCLDQGVKSGHFAVYSQGEGIDDAVYACDEEEYLRDVEAAGAWGAVNHPDNADGGSRWHCWAMGDRRLVDLTGSPIDRSVPGPDCGTGVADQRRAVRAVEIVNDRNMPTSMSLRQVDALLLQGQRVALVGGGDAHTSRACTPSGSPTRRSATSRPGKLLAAAADLAASPPRGVGCWPAPAT